MPLNDILNEYQSGQNVTFVHDTHTTAETVAEEEVSCPESHAPDSQQVNTNNQDLVCQQELPLDHNPWAEDCIDAVVAHPAVPDVEQRLRWAVRNRKRLVKVIIVGGLSLIVLPGIMLGILMKDTRAGIALSTAIIGLIKLLADLYNYLNTRD